MNIHEILLDRAKKEGIKWAEKGRKLLDIEEERCKKIGCDSIHELIESVNGSDVLCPYLEAFDKAYIATKTSEVVDKTGEAPEVPKNKDKDYDEHKKNELFVLSCLIYENSLISKYDFTGLFDVFPDVYQHIQTIYEKYGIVSIEDIYGFLWIDEDMIFIAENQERLSAKKTLSALSMSIMCLLSDRLHSKCDMFRKLRQIFPKNGTYELKETETTKKLCELMILKKTPELVLEYYKRQNEKPDNDLEKRVAALESWSQNMYNFTEKVNKTTQDWSAKMTEAHNGLNKEYEDRISALETWKEKAQSQRHLNAIAVAQELVNLRNDVDTLFNLQTVAVKEIKDLQAENGALKKAVRKLRKVIK